ncbi:ExbD/TolR family protein [Undibacterium sp. Ren11W]|uniref:ExbD/TolR family protein n=1 Tax=Undibacterium sp. Ren11W TaxID=3413045 RepID=UPI003BF1F004
MAFGKFNGRSERSPLLSISDINVTPMVDVMLVLLVIFILTAPLLLHSIPLALPKVQAQAAPQAADAATLSMDAKGDLYWNAEPIKLAELDAKLSALVKKNPQVELRLRADQSTQYGLIAQVMAAAQAQGISKIGFVTASTTESNSAKANKN